MASEPVSDHDLLVRHDIQISRIYQDVRDLHRDLYGNGQPGIEGRVSTLEQHRWKMVGVVAGLFVVAQFVQAWFQKCPH